MYNQFSSEYYEKGLQVMPLRGKRPFINNWTEVSFEGRSFKGANIGLKTGKHSGVICIDIDTTDKELKDKIYALLPPLYCGKIGNPNKGINYFFAYNGETNRKIGGIVELLSTGNQTVLPPSKHPDGYTYEWRGKSLLEIDIDDLAPLPNDFLDNVEKLVLGLNLGVSSFEQKGRHNALVEIGSAMVGRQEPLESIVKELLEYDANNHDTPYFTDSTEAHRGKGYASAVKMVTSLIDTHTRKGNPYEPCKHEIDLEMSAEQIEAKAVKEEPRKTYPHFRGIAQDMFKYIYENSPVPRSRFACASVISLISITIANRIKFQGFYPNLYSLIVAPSGAGKDFPLKFPKYALMEAGQQDLIGQSNPASDTGIIKTLPNQRERLDVIDEASILFGAITNNPSAYASKMSDVYASLFTSCGDYYEGKIVGAKDKPIGQCHSPYVSMLCGMTPEALRGTFTTQLIDTGLGARFLYFVDELPKKGRRIGERKPIPSNITNFIRLWRVSETNKINIASGFGGAQAVEAESNCEDMLDKIFDQIELLKQKESGKITAILNRAYGTIMKLALIDAVSCSPFSKNIEVKDDNLLWALEFFMVNFKEANNFIESNVSSNQTERMRLYLEDVIKKEGAKGITAKKLGRRTCGKLDMRQRKYLIDELLELELVYRLKVQGKTKPTTYFMHSAYWKQ